MADIKKLAKLLGFGLQHMEFVRIKDIIKKKESEGRTLTNSEIKKIIKNEIKAAEAGSALYDISKKSNKPTMLDVAGKKEGGYVKTYAKGSTVRRIRSY